MTIRLENVSFFWLKFFPFLVKDEKAISKLESKLGIIEGEIIDLKNKGRNNNRSQMITGAMGGVGGIGMST